MNVNVHYLQTVVISSSFTDIFPLSAVFFNFFYSFIISLLLNTNSKIPLHSLNIIALGESLKDNVSNLTVSIFRRKPTLCGRQCLLIWMKFSVLYSGQSHIMPL